MKIAGVNPNATGPYDGIAYEIYVSGCTHHCPGCHNPELQWFDYGDEWEDKKKEIFADLFDMRGWYDCIAILGGDLLSQDRKVAQEMVRELKLRTQVPIWLFTGNDVEKIPRWVWKKFDVVKYGPYIKELRQEGFPASSNQVVWRKRDVWHRRRKTIRSGAHTNFFKRG